MDQSGVMKNSRLNTFTVRNTHFLISIPLKQVVGHKRKPQTRQITALRKSYSNVVAKKVLIDRPTTLTAMQCIAARDPFPISSV